MQEINVSFNHHSIYAILVNDLSIVLLIIHCKYGKMAFIYRKIHKNTLIKLFSNSRKLYSNHIFFSQWHLKPRKCYSYFLQYHLSCLFTCQSHKRSADSQTEFGHSGHHTIILPSSEIFIHFLLIWKFSGSLPKRLSVPFLRIYLIPRKIYFTLNSSSLVHSYIHLNPHHVILELHNHFLYCTVNSRRAQIFASLIFIVLKYSTQIKHCLISKLLYQFQPSSQKVIIQVFEVACITISSHW